MKKFFLCFAVGLLFLIASCGDVTINSPSEPTNPTDPTTEPTTEPTNPTDPTTEPTDEPTNPTEPTDEPTEPTNPTEPTEPTEPTNPTEPTEPTNPTEPTEPTNPTEPTEPTNPTEPTEPTNPTETEEEKCVAAGGTYNADGKCTRTVECPVSYEKGDNTEWNGNNGFYTQEYVNGVWVPETVQTVYSEEAGVCHFKCTENYYRSGNVCWNGCDGDPCNYIDNSDHTCNPTGFDTFECGCVDGYIWNGGTKECVLTPCTIDDSFTASDYEEHFLFKGAGSITENNVVDNTFSSIDTIELDLLNDAYDLNTYNFAFAQSYDGTLTLAVLKALSSDYSSYLLFGTQISADALNNAEILPNGKVNLDIKLSQFYISDTLYENEERVQRSCLLAVNQYTDNSFSKTSGRAQLCLGDNRNFAGGEAIQIGIDTQLNSDEDYIAAVQNHSGDAVCSFYCTDGNAEVKDPETGRCGCKDGYAWDNSSQSCVENSSCAIDDSFATSDYENHFVFKGAGSVNSTSNLSSGAMVSAIELDLTGDAYNFDNYYFAGLANEDSNLDVVVIKPLSDDYSSYLTLVSQISGDDLNNAEILSDGKVNLNAPLTQLSVAENLYSGEESVQRACIVGVNQYTDNSFSSGTGRAQLCLGDNRNFAINESIKIGVDVELNSDEEYIAAVQNHLGKELCVFYCLNANAEVKDAETGRCGCIDGYTWDNSSQSCVENSSCEIDDSFESSDYEEHFLFKGVGSILSEGSMVQNAFSSIDAIELDLLNDAYDLDTYNFAWAQKEGGNLDLFVLKLLSNDGSSYLVFVSQIPADALNSAEILPNGKVNLDAQFSQVSITETLYSGEEKVQRACAVAVNQYTDNSFSTRTGRTQLCLGDNRNFAGGEDIKIGMDVELNSDEDYITSVKNLSGYDVCSFSCYDVNAEVKDAETGRCGCIDGYTWNGSSCVNVAEEECMAVGGTWDGTQCTIDGLSVCSETSTTPCIDPESSLIWSKISDDGMELEYTDGSGNVIYPASDYCEGLEEGGFTDWRLPDINELRTLIRNCPATQFPLVGEDSCKVTGPDHLSYNDWSNDSCVCAYDANDPGKYSKFGDSVWLWSSSVRSDDSSHAWYISFSYGYLDYETLNENFYVRCVR